MNLRTLAGAVALAFTAAANAQFNAGDIFVNTSNYQGTAARTNLGNTATIQRFDTVSGTFVQQFGTPIINSGTATSEGALQYDPTSGTLWFGGYTSVSASGSVTGTTSASNPRLAAQLFSTGTVTTFGTSTDYSGNNFRSAVGIGGAIYTAGGASGVRSYATPSTGLLGSGNTESGTVTTTRVASFYDGSVYYSAQSGTQVGVMRGGATPTVIAASPSAYGFRFSLDGLQTLYVADDSTTTGATPTGGIRKYVKNTGGTYDLLGRYTIPAATGTGAVGARGIALRPFVDSTGVQRTTIVATTSDDSGTVPNRLVSFLDDNNFATGTTTVIPTSFAVLATAGANEVFRGVEVVPEPASLAILGVGALGLLRRRRAR